MQLSQALQAYSMMVAACSFEWRTDLFSALTAYGSQHLGKSRSIFAQPQRISMPLCCPYGSVLSNL